MLLSDFIHKGTRSLEPLYPSKEAHNIVLMLCEALLGVQSYTHIVEPETVVDPSREPGLLAALEIPSGYRLDMASDTTWRIVTAADGCLYVSAK